MDALPFLGLALAACAGVMIDRWLLRPVTKCDLEVATAVIISVIKGGGVGGISEGTKKRVEKMQAALNKLDAQVTDK